MQDIARAKAEALLEAAYEIERELICCDAGPDTMEDHGGGICYWSGQCRDLLLMLAGKYSLEAFAADQHSGATPPFGYAERVAVDPAPPSAEALPIGGETSALRRDYPERWGGC